MDNDENKNIDRIFQIDPDYESTNTAIRRVELREEEESKLTEEKLRTIIQEEFDKELQIRQKQLEEIEEKVFKAQKLLHVVRYVLISSYYNNKALEFESTSGTSLESTNILTGQNRIHPAVKKLLGKNANNLKFLGARTKRKATIIKSESTAEPSTPKKLKLEVEKLGENLSAPISITKPEQAASKNIVDEPVTNRTKIQHRLVVGNISYFKRSLEQNNLTHKWMVYVKIFKGSREGPEITNLAVSKVVFYLHPSYKPHDVVDISQPPYHLSRRGWGEFPLRVKIYFKSPMNKPIDVIHQLKLDSTFTERQTLGNQTVVPIFLYDDHLPNSNEESIIKNLADNSLYTEKLNNNITTIGSIGSLSLSTNSLLNDQIISIQPIKIEPSTTGYEHDYCYDNVSIKQEILDDQLIKEENEEKLCTNPEILNRTVLPVNYLVRDHPYSLPPDKKGLKSPKKNKSPIKQAYNELIYGLGLHYLDPLRAKPRSVRPKIIDNIKNNTEKNTKSVLKVFKTVANQPIRFLPESFSQVILNNGTIVPVTFLKSPSPTTKSIRDKDIISLEAKFVNSTSSSKSNAMKFDNNGIKILIKQEKQLLKLPNHIFKNMGEALPYLFKRLPLWTIEASNPEYKCAYPFTARSEKEYLSWNIGKKLSAEWSRAKTIKRIISEESYSKNWSVKAIFMYGRSHLFTPLVRSYRLFEKESLEKHLISNCFQSNSLQNGYSAYPDEIKDEAINITSPVKPVIDTTDPNYLDGCIDISDKSISQECTYVKETALDVGVMLKSEVLVNGVAMNASERMIFEAVKCFAENIIRRSRNFLVSQQGYNNETSEITCDEVRQALDERKEFQSIKQFKENKLTMDFFS